MKKSRQANGRKTSHRIKLSTIAALGALGLSINASAQGNADDPIDEIEGISSYEILPDDTLLITLESGETLTLTSDAYVVIGEQVFLRESGAALVQAAIQSGVSNAGMMAAAMGLGALGGVSQIDGDGGTDPIETDTTAPEFTSSASASTAESSDATTVVYDADATDAGTVSYALSGTDSALFEIDSATGEVTFLTAPDFEAPGDADGDGVFEVTITASDGTNSSSLDVAITLTDINDEAPVFTSSDSVEAVAETATDTVYTATVTDADTDAPDITFSLAETGDSQYFDIDASTGEVTLKDSIDHDAPLDSDGDNIYNIQITASDGDNETTHVVAITITDAADEDPVFSSSTTASMDENETDTGYTAQATPDVDGDTVTYSIVGGAQGHLFDVDPATGKLVFKDAPDHEAPYEGFSLFGAVVSSEAGWEVIEDFPVGALISDGDQNGIFELGDLVLLNGSSEELYFAGTIEIAGHTILVVVESSTGELATGSEVALALPFGVDPDEIDFPTFEELSSLIDTTPLSLKTENIYEVEIQAEDASGNTSTQTVTITVSDTADEAPVFTSATSVTGVPEDETDTIYTATVTDADTDASGITFSLAPGGDSDFFTIDAQTGEVTLQSTVDHDAANDADGDHTYNIQIIASDGDNQSTHEVSITITDVADEDPVFTSGTMASMDEEQTDTGYSAVADPDLDGAAVTYSIVGGAHGHLFDIDSATGKLAFSDAPDYEAPYEGFAFFSVAVPFEGGWQVYEDATANGVITDDDGDGSLEAGDVLLIDGRDLGNYFAGTIEIAGSTIVVMSVSSTGEIATLSDVNLLLPFGIDPNEIDFPTLEDLLSLLDTTPYSIKTDNIYEVEIQAEDASGNASTQTISVTVNDVDEAAPVFSNSVVDVNANENTSTSTVVFDANATDANGANPNTDDAGITYTLGGDDADDFDIDPDTGQVSFRAGEVPPDHENPADQDGDNVYDITIIAEDAEKKTTELDVTITVDDVSESNPVFTSGPTASVNENEAGAVYTAQATPDVDGAPVSYTINGGAHADLFTIDETTGEVSFKDAPNHEAPTYGWAAGNFAVWASGDITGTPANSSVYSTPTLINEPAPPVGDPWDGVLSIGDSLVQDGSASSRYEFYGTIEKDGQTLLVFQSDAGEILVFGPANTGSGLIDLTGLSLSDVDRSSWSLPPTHDYQIVIESDDGDNDALQTVTITVNDTGDDDPVFTSGTTVNVDENDTATGYTPAADPDVDGAEVTYAISGGADEDLFELDSSTGELKFKSAPDHETPGDEAEDGTTAIADDNVYEVEITATETGGSSTVQTVSVTVGDVPDEDPVFSSGATASMDEEQTDTGYSAAADPDLDGAAVTYSIVGGAQGHLFDIDSATGKLVFKDAPDYEAPYEGFAAFSLSTNQGSGWQVFDGADVQALLTDADDDGILEVGDPVWVDGNVEALFFAGTIELAGQTVLVATTPPFDEVETTSTLLLFPFGIDPNEIAIPTLEELSALLDTTPYSLKTNNTYEVEIQAEDASGNSSTQTVDVTVNDVDEEAPVFSNTETAVSENENIATSAVVFDADATDPNGANPSTADAGITYTLSGDDAEDFDIDEGTGEVTFKSPNGSPNHENPADDDSDNVYDITIIAEDTENQTTELDVSITVDDVSESDPVFNSATTANVDENEAGTVYTAQATPDVDGATVVYTINGGAHHSLFEIDQDSGALSFKSAPDHEAPLAGFAFGGFARYVDSVADSNEAEPVSGLITEDPAAGSVNGVLEPGEDVLIDGVQTGYEYQGTVTIAGQTLIVVRDGTATFIYVPAGIDLDTISFEDDLSNLPPIPRTSYPLETTNEYEVEIQARDGIRWSTQTVTITVGDTADEDPVFTSSATASVTEGGTGTGYQAAADPDVDGATVTYKLTGGDDVSLFTISDTGVVTFVTAPAYSDGGENTYEFVVTAEEADGQTSTQTVTITVTEDTSAGPQSPSFTSGTTASTAENVDTSTVVYTATATDADSSQSDLTFSLAADGDNDLFSIDPDTGEVTFDASPDHETPGDSDDDNDYEITVIVKDEDDNSTSQNVTITVTDAADDDPSFTTGTRVDIDENAADVIYTAQATPDVAGAKVTYVLGGHPDSALFSIDEDTGELSFITPPDFENPHDSDQTNSYGATITATEEDGESVTQHVIFFVKNVGEAEPDFTSGTIVRLNENKADTVYTARATPDVNGAAVTYEITGGADKDLFELDPTSGEMKFISAPDHETPLDRAEDGTNAVAGDNVYEVEITATEEKGEQAVQKVSLTVSDVIETDPVFTSNTSVTMDENQVTTGYTPTAVPDVVSSTVTYAITGGDDKELFKLNETTGELEFEQAPDFETPGSHQGSNTYVVIITATNNSRSSTQTVTITVEDASDAGPPVFNSPASATIFENTTDTGITPTATSDHVGGSLEYSIVGGTHADLFEIDAQSGELKLKNEQDYEAPYSEFAFSGWANYPDRSSVFKDRTSLTTQDGTISEKSNPSDSHEVDGVLTHGEQVLIDGVYTGETYFGTLMFGQNTLLVTLDERFTLRTYAPEGLVFDDSVTPVQLAFYQFEQTDFNLTPVRTFEVIVEAYDGNKTSTQTINVTVEDVAPEFSNTVSSVNQNENTSTSTIVFDAQATNPAGSNPNSADAGITYSLSGVDADDFNIDPDSGEVTFDSVPDYENPDDTGGDGTYDITVVATVDGTSETASYDVTISVNDVADEDPIFTSLATASMDENETGTGLLLSADPDISGDTVSYSIVGGAHGDLFTIDALTNELKFINEPDYESPVSAYAADSVVRIDASAAERTIEQDTNVITENPNSLVGNENGTLEIGEAVLINGEDTSETFAGIVTLGGNEIIVTASAQADGTTDYNVYAPSGVDATTLSSSISGDMTSYVTQVPFNLPETNDYQIVVEADEGGRTSTQTITITVEDVLEGSALPLSGFSLSTVKLDAELLEDLEGTVVSTPTDPAAPPTAPSTPQELTKLPAIDWVDDGFVAAQMQLDMSDALDGF